MELALYLIRTSPGICKFPFGPFPATTERGTNSSHPKTTIERRVRSIPPGRAIVVTTFDVQVQAEMEKNTMSSVADAVCCGISITTGNF
jgi:hypothetical protein